jgi:adenine-specific DNA methylase
MDHQLIFPKKVIETYFPFSKVSEIAYKESNAKRYYRPVLTLHKWFARRLGSVFRSILIYAALSSPINELKGKSGASEVLISEKKFWDIYLKEHDFHNLVILDPFMGGGTTIVEAIRLGFKKVIGGDLNPVAWFTVKKELEEVNIDVLQTKFNEISTKIILELSIYYKTNCEHCLQTADVMYFFWVKEIRCGQCLKSMSLFRSYLFAYKRTDSTIGYVLCPQCGVISQEPIRKDSQCPECSYIFDPLSYIVKRGKYFCPHCEHSAKIIDVSNNQGNLSQKLYALEYYCPHCKTRDYKRADSNDHELYQRACQEFESIHKQLPLPNQPVPIGAKTQELINHGFLVFSDMFNPRQLLTLGKLLREILQIQDQNTREFFLITFSTALEYNNLLCEYHRKNHYIYNLFRKHAFPATLNPVENNVFGTAKFGTGTFKNFFAKTVRIKEFCQNPYEYYITKNGEAKRQPMTRPISGRVVSSYSQLMAKPNDYVYLYCHSSHQIQIPNNSVDLVITDPPYYDNVQYAELSDFYYVWLRLGLEQYYSCFKSPLSPKNAEIVKNPKIGKTDKDYINGLKTVFAEVNRVLKEEGLFIFTFHHKQLRAWSSLIESLLDNDFYITAAYPVRAEMETSTQIRGKRSIEFDVIFVCRKRQGKPETIEWGDLIPQIKSSIKRKVNRLTRNGDTLSDEDLLVIKYGVGLKYYSQCYPEVKLEGKPFPIIDALKDLTSIE